MSNFTVSPEAREVYRAALDRAASQNFLLWEISNQAEAEQAIEELFAVAALTEELSGEAPGLTDVATEAGPTLSLAEARLAAATLDLVDGSDDLTNSSEASEALDLLTGTLLQAVQAPLHHQSFAEWLENSSAERGRGWRRISDRAAAREIRGIYHSSAVAGLDLAPGLGSVDAVFVHLGLNYFAGTGTISLGDIWTAGGVIEAALRRFVPAA